MKNLRLIAGLFITTAFIVGCAVSSEPGDKSIRIDNPTVTHQGDVSVVSNGEVSVTTPSLTLTKQSDVVDEAAGDVCCTGCNIFTGDCKECHTCILDQ
jgi:hypothetical protein